MAIAPHFGQPPKIGQVFCRDDEHMGRYEAMLVWVNVRDGGHWDGMLVTNENFFPVSSNRFTQAVHHTDWRPVEWVWSDGAFLFAPGNLEWSQERAQWVERSSAGSCRPRVRASFEEGPSRAKEAGAPRYLARSVPPQVPGAGQRRRSRPARRGLERVQDEGVRNGWTWSARGLTGPYSERTGSGPVRSDEPRVQDQEPRVDPGGNPPGDSGLLPV
jgi:hypothetical protein